MSDNQPVEPGALSSPAAEKLQPPWLRTIELDRLRFVVQVRLKTRELAISPQVELIGLLGEELAVRLTQEIFGRQSQVVISYPAGLWEYIKASLGLKHRRKVHKVNGQLLFPDINVPGHRACVIVRDECETS